ncbi:MAG: prolyl oligopeptidase family serine peptidase [Saprospiraceae bacterium]
MKPYILVLLLLMMVGMAQAQSPSPDNLIPRELLFKEKDKNKVTLTTDGEFILYQKMADGSDSTLYFVSGRSPSAEKSRKFDGAIADWTTTYDGGIVVVVRRDTSLQVEFTTLGAKNAKKLDVQPFTRMEFIYQSPRFPNKVVVNFTAKDETQNGIYFLDLFSGNMRRLGTMGDFQQIYFDENFGMVAALGRNDLGGNSIFVRREGIWEEVRKYPFNPEMFIGGLSRIISVSGDGKTVYATDNLDKDKTTLVAIDVESGQVTELASDPDADILPYAFTLDPNGKPTSVAALWGDTKRHILDESIRKDFEFLDKELNGKVGFAGSSLDEKLWLVRKIDGGPQTYYHYDRANQKLTELFNDFSYLNGYDLPTRTAVTITTRDSLRIPANIYVPPGMSNTKGMPKVPLPTVIYIHGGPWAGVTHWNNWFHTRNFQLLANRGYVVIVMEFRGTTGLGKAVCDAGDKQWGEKMHNDIVDVATWAIKSGVSNRKRIALWGWSYGGYAVNFALGAAPDLFAAGVSMYGIADLPAFCKLPFADNDLWRNRVGDVNTEEGAALLKAHSPTTYLKDIHSPILLTTGSQDDRVPQQQVDDFAKALHNANKDVIYFYYPDEGHDYQKPETWISFWAIAEDFLNKHVGGRKEPKKDDIEKGNFTTVFGAEYIEEIK